MSHKLKVCLTAYGTPLYEACVRLRGQVLRAPLGLAMSAEDLATEPTCLHFAALAGGALVGAGALEPRANSTFYLKQLAVSTVFQQQGTGTGLMQTMEQASISQRGQLLALHSRVSAIGFYQKLGYHLEGGSFLEFTIPHIGMYKWL